jgi:hypothetical protein
VQKCWAKTILLSQTSMFLTFLHPILICRSHTQHQWSCSNALPLWHCCCGCSKHTMSRVYHQVTDSAFINRFSTRPFLINCSINHWTGPQWPLAREYALCMTLFFLKEIQ